MDDKTETMKHNGAPSKADQEGGWHQSVVDQFFSSRRKLQRYGYRLAVNTLSNKTEFLELFKKAIDQLPTEAANEMLSKELALYETSISPNERLHLFDDKNHLHYMLEYLERSTSGNSGLEPLKGVIQHAKERFRPKQPAREVRSSESDDQPLIAQRKVNKKKETPKKKLLGKEERAKLQAKHRCARVKMLAAHDGFLENIFPGYDNHLDEYETNWVDHAALEIQEIWYSLAKKSPSEFPGDVRDIKRLDGKRAGQIFDEVIYSHLYDRQPAAYMQERYPYHTACLECKADPTVQHMMSLIEQKLFKEQDPINILLQRPMDEGELDYIYKLRRKCYNKVITQLYKSRLWKRYFQADIDWNGQEETYDDDDQEIPRCVVKGGKIHVVDWVEEAGRRLAEVIHKNLDSPDESRGEKSGSEGSDNDEESDQDESGREDNQFDPLEVWMGVDILGPVKYLEDFVFHIENVLKDKAGAVEKQWSATITDKLAKFGQHQQLQRDDKLDEATDPEIGVRRTRETEDDASSEDLEVGNSVNSDLENRRTIKAEKREVVGLVQDGDETANVKVGVESKSTIVGIKRERGPDEKGVVKRETTSKKMKGGWTIKTGL
ncbi:hypothetical protein BJ508DRAFT_410947 [Ascobolus immersus RN42]|uniref:Uncharacterized protein n=1 Tax=Ascobolus immersus RN42 TaxID=1160509 RepID=A0A3N4ILK0_ASCIM|nr:hypothetical protein BJ508DRAFT_410947 [Ascobolus immersus RN42]